MGSREKLDDIIKDSDSIEIRDKSELEGVADIMFSPKRMNSSIRINAFERSNIVVCDIISNLFGFDSFGITDDFKELSQSIDGWKTNKFVEVGQSRNEETTGRTWKEKFASWITPKN